jgi:hypothetical protein
MDLKLSNNSYTKLTNPINNIQTTFNVENGSVLPSLGTNEYFYLDIIDLTDGTYETVKVTSRINNSITCIRESGGTSAKNFSINSPCGLRINKAIIDDIINYMENNLGSNGLFANTSTYNLIDTVATTINFGGEATKIDIGSSNGVTNINHSLRVFGNLTVDGLTTILNSTTISIDDPIFTLGGDTSPTIDDGKDRGIEFRWHDGFDPKVGFFGFQNSSHKFVFIPSATNNSEVFSGTLGIVQARTFESVAPTGDAPFTVASTTVVSNLNADLLDGYNGSYYTNASNLSSGTVPTARLGSGTADVTTYLRGDNTWGTIPSGTTIFEVADNKDYYLVFTLNKTGSFVAADITSSKLGFNPSTGILSATGFSGSGQSLTSLDASKLLYGIAPAAALGSGTANINTVLRGDSTWGSITEATISDGTILARVGSTETITAIWTFNAIPAFNGGISGTSSPFTVDSTTVVSNLNSDLLDGYNASDFQLSFSLLNDIHISDDLTGNRISSINLHGDDLYTNYSLRIGRTVSGVTEIIHRGTQDFSITTPDQSKISFNTDQLVISSTGKVGINTSNPSYNLEVNGSFAAKTKSFQIDHPTKENYKLQYGSLESPYHGIRLTGKGITGKNSFIVNLPPYINKLVSESGINIQLTPIGFINTLWVESIDLENNKFKVGSDLEGSEFFWSFTAIRKDVDNLIVELENN